TKTKDRKPMSERNKATDRNPAREAELAAASCSDKVRVREVHETKVADEINVGMEVTIMTLFGPGKVRVTEINREAGNARAVSNRIVAFLERRDDGWYDQHCHGSLDAIAKVQFD